MNFFFLCSFLLLMISSATASNGCIHKSKAKFYSGACGYRSLVSNLSGESLAGGVSSLYNNGIGCGMCLRVRCTDKALCSTRGTNVLLFDLNNDNQIDLVLSKAAFQAMAITFYKRGELLNKGIVGVKYQRIPCNYKQNLTVRVEEMSNPYFLGLKFLYQGGQTDIVSVEIGREVKKSRMPWQQMKRNYGAIWSSGVTPGVALKLQVGVIDGYKTKKVESPKVVIPSNWKIGKAYDTGLKITSTKQEKCSK
ncbi:expansin-like A2 isoform X2 [Malania oleifera]|uniref:expansin-like A2 isoform X2 n=1 Tax=Malania oleifera TaxID=397392 RepID=UPI0025AE9E90|nr:expansin-like A2 isoform X2 [Malania oleifera]